MVRAFLKVSLASLFLLGMLIVPAACPRVAAQTEAISVSAYMTSYSYAPGDRAHLAVNLELPETRENSLSLEFVIYPAAITRSQLASFRQGKRRSPMITNQLETIATGTVWKNKEYAIELDELGLESGVYPFEVKLSEGGETIASSYDFLVIMRPTVGKPLNLSPLWTIDFLPLKDAQGNYVDTGLMRACSASSQEPGFLYALVKTLKQIPEVPSNVIIPKTTYEDLEMLASRADSQDATESEKGAAEIIQLLSEMTSSGQIDSIRTTYSYADPDILLNMGWEEDANYQLRPELGESRQIPGQSRGFVPPLFDLTDTTVQRLSGGGADFTVVNEETLASSAAGRELLEGDTLCQPVNFSGLEGSFIKAFPRDEGIYRFLGETTEVDPSRLTQGIVAELAMLQREKPYAVRSCVLAFPPGFMPSKEFLKSFYNTVKGYPWLTLAPLSQLNKDQFALQGISLPAPPYQEAESAYSKRLGRIRSDATAYAKAIQLEKHPLKAQLERSILVAENYRFMTERDPEAAQDYLGSMEDLVRGEMAKVRIEQKRSFMLSSTQGNLSVAISSSLDYPITANLRMENPSLSFDSQDDITIRPRENSFAFSVNTHRKGSFLVDIILETNGLVIDQASTTVNTSIINTLAIVLLAGLAFIVAAIILGRRLSQNPYRGKHSRGRSS